MSSSYPTIDEYEHIDLGNNITLFKVYTSEGDSVDIEIDTTEPKQSLALGGTMEAYHSDVIGHILYELNELENT